MTVTSAELLQRIAKGDEGAFADFYRHYESRLYRFIKTKLNDSFEAADILNETFLEVWRKADTFEGRSKVSTWLFGIAYYKTMDAMRKKSKTPTPVDEDKMPELVDDNASALEGILDGENAKHVKDCLETLKPNHKAVMELSFFEDMSYAEISEIVGCPENTVKTRMFHAKEAMKHCLIKKMGGKS